MIQKLWSIKLTRFLCVGLFNTALDFILLNTLVFVFNLPVLVANTVSVCIGVSISFFLNHYIVFRKDDVPTYKAFTFFFLVTGISILVVQTIVIASLSPAYSHIFHSLLGTFNERSLFRFEEKLTLNFAKATAVLVGMIWNYLLYSKFVFVQKATDEQ